MKKMILVLAFLCSIFVQESFAQQISISTSIGENAYLHGLTTNGYQSKNFCKYPSLAAASWTFQGTQAPTRSIFKFDFPAECLRGKKVVSAKLVLKHYIAPGNENNVNHPQNDNSFEIRRVTQAWKCASVNWLNQPAVGTNVVTVPNVGVLTGTNDDITVDVTSLVQEMLQSGNFGFMMKFKDEKSTYRSRWFGSFSAPVGKRPVLEIILQ